MRNIITTVDGIKFRSKKEANRYCELKLLERAGKIKNLKLQVKYELYPSLEISNVFFTKILYICDFQYESKYGTCVEDVKGRKAGIQYDIFKIKKRLMWEKYSIYVIEI